LFPKKKKERNEMRTNVKATKQKVVNYEGALVSVPSFVPAVNDEIELRRAVLSTLLGEDTYYESGKSIKARIAELVTKVSPAKVAALAVQARDEMHLRHVPLFLVREMARNKDYRSYVEDTLFSVIRRADELAEFKAMYFSDNPNQPMAASVKKGLARAFNKFNEYSLAKYNRDGAWSLRDVLFMVHAKPKDDEQAAVWKRLVDGTLATPDTWEVELSRDDGVTKKDKWTRLIMEKKLGALALLRNLSGMTREGVDVSLIVDAINEADTSQVLPFRFIAANRATGGKYMRHLDNLLLKNLKESKIRLRGKTAVLIDVSGSMDSALSAKSDLTRMDAAAALGVIVSELADTCDVYTFSGETKLVKAVRGLSGIENIINSQPHGGTYMADAIEKVQNIGGYNRLIVVTDEQAQDANRFKGKTVFENNYVINTAPYRSGVGVSYTQGVSNGKTSNWVAINGFSEAVIRYISEMENISNESSWSDRA
jgi:60 kDa SS-A/Ro ribonucleoprotein